MSTLPTGHSGDNGNEKNIIGGNLVPYFTSPDSYGGSTSSNGNGTDNQLSESINHNPSNYHSMLIVVFSPSNLVSK